MTDDTIINDARSVMADGGASPSVVLKDSAGREIPLPDQLNDLIVRTLAAIAKDETISLLRIPDELTSTVAADILGVSRPTVMKWAREGKISSFSVGAHTRFYADDILRFKQQREQEQQAAFAELRAMDRELGIEE